jgi:hypothetical protein
LRGAKACFARDFFEVFEPMLREVEGITEVSVGGVSICRHAMLDHRPMSVHQGVPEAFVPGYQGQNMWDSFGLFDGTFSLVIDTR